MLNYLYAWQDCDGQPALSARPLVKSVGFEFRLTYTPGKAVIESIPDFGFYTLISDGGSFIKTFRSECEARIYAAAGGIECEDRTRVIGLAQGAAESVTASSRLVL